MKGFYPEMEGLYPISRVPDDFLESAGVSVQTFLRLEQASGADATKLRDAFSFALAYDAVVQEAAAFARALAHTIRVQRAEAGASALDIYAFAQRLSKQRRRRAPPVRRRHAEEACQAQTDAKP